MTSKPLRLMLPPDSGVYHGVRKGRVKCGVSYNHDHVARVEEADISDRDACGNCWRNRSLREGVEEFVEDRQT